LYCKLFFKTQSVHEYSISTLIAEY